MCVGFFFLKIKMCNGIRVKLWWWYKAYKAQEKAEKDFTGNSNEQQIKMQRRSVHLEEVRTLQRSDLTMRASFLLRAQEKQILPYFSGKRSKHIQVRMKDLVKVGARDFRLQALRLLVGQNSTSFFSGQRAAAPLPDLPWTLVFCSNLFSLPIFYFS